MTYRAPHVTAVTPERGEPAPDGYRWTCTCGKSRDGYPTRVNALNGAEAHRTIAKIDEDTTP